MYTPEEYAAGRNGWGHSTWEQGVELAQAAGVGRLLLSHLNPDHSDRDIEPDAEGRQGPLPAHRMRRGRPGRQALGRTDMNASTPQSLYATLAVYLLVVVGALLVFCSSASWLRVSRPGWAGRAASS